ncbi:MAG: rRNA maturation RNase YbeY [Celeribacter sp.]|jgi:probable rRNA maturation factor
MTETVDCLIEAEGWLPLDLPALAERAVAATLGHLGLAAECEVSLIGCDDARIAALNAEFRGKLAATNVLSWPAEERAPDIPGAVPDLPEPDLPDMPIELGDIAIALETCTREAMQAGRPVSDHVTHLIIHACLHLLGYDHETDPDAALMEGIEVEILGNLGLPDPY